MTTPALSVRPAHRSRPLLILGVLALAVTSIGTGVFSLAYFTSQTTVGANAFTAGTIVIGASPSSALLTLNPMMPGDSVTAALTVSNTGTAQLRYAISAATTNPDTKDLRSQLTVSVKSGVTTCTNAGFAGSGTSVRSAIALGATTVVAGDNTAGSQAGDRTLNAGANEVLCFQVSLPTTTGNTYQGATAVTTFTFDAEQTANNP